ncbi:MAG TPA: hypothetical protein IAB03_06495 [Candidatus Gallibacteroides avistercoris]|uniref:Uncharacterized protein n=1 Tax=Candidatus Gallibacteroides avistercoris TaxID=2840833 RepID=A0A9D1M8I5_9BACT|nr:hypothetical protein [Candidatus Gallibacteroides avistercoris]
MMNRRTDVLEEIYNDEIVNFLADRYRTTSREILQRFLEQNDSVPEMESGTFRLEENEMAILRDMMARYHR